mmetsp:Transcript_40232/g.115619  ORF Transcript_40232/g.115619 Transcript_40232/m.115619 type:complete len:228 (+) Transcript_40232:191-874(+)
MRCSSTVKRSPTCNRAISARSSPSISAIISRCRRIASSCACVSAPTCAACSARDTRRPTSSIAACNSGTLDRTWPKPISISSLDSFNVCNCSRAEATCSRIASCSPTARAWVCSSAPARSSMALNRSRIRGKSTDCSVMPTCAQFASRSPSACAWTCSIAPARSSMTLIRSRICGKSSDCSAASMRCSNECIWVCKAAISLRSSAFRSSAASACCFAPPGCSTTSNN